MPTEETEQRNEKEAPAHMNLGKTYFSNGKWYCECNQPARVRTTKRSGPNHRRKFWTCVAPGNCDFFLWVDHEDAAKESLRAKAGLDPQPPQTPTKNGSNSTDPGTRTVSGVGPQRSSPQIRETPFTKAKRKAASREYPIRDVAQDLGAAGIEDPFTYPPFHTESERKATKTSVISTPGQKFTERLKSSINSLPTPQTRDPDFAPSAAALETLLMETRDTSPTPTKRNGTNTRVPKGETDLTTTVLGLIRADNVRLKGSTEFQIRHEINLALALNVTRVQGHEGTISELKKRIDELENLILHLT